MRDYILILLTVIGATFLLNSLSPNNAEILSDISANTESSNKSLIVPITETHIEPILDDVASIEIDSAFSSNLPKTPAKTSSIPNYTITKTSTSVAKNPGNAIIKVNKLVYGHNSSNLLGSALNLGINSTFTITENGAATTYKVGETALFKKIDDYTLSLCSSNNYNDCNYGTYYMNTLQSARFKNKNYSLALFTCDGDSLSGGDATHRKVIFANQI